MLLGKNDSSEQEEEGDHVLAEPQPDWPEAVRSWGVAWTVHVYGFGVSYGIVFAYGVYSIARLRRKLRPQPYVLAIAVFVVLMSLLRTCFLLIDPYQSRDILPPVLVRMLNALVYPCLITMFTLLQVIIVRFTKVSADRTSVKKTHHMLLTFITAYFLSTVVITLVVGWNIHLKFLILFIQGVFISWGLIVCFSFVYNGFKVAQFTSEANRALREFTRYSKIRKEALRSGKPSHLALHRVTKPRIRDEADMAPMEIEPSCQSASESSDSNSFFNDGFGENEAYHVTTPASTAARCIERRVVAEAKPEDSATSSADGGSPSLSANSPRRGSSTPTECDEQSTSSMHQDTPREETMKRYKSNSSSRHRWRSDQTCERKADGGDQRPTKAERPIPALASYFRRNGLLSHVRKPLNHQWSAKEETLLVQTNKAFDMGSCPTINRSSELVDQGTEETPFVVVVSSHASGPDGENTSGPDGGQNDGTRVPDDDPGEGGYMADTEPNSPKIQPCGHNKPGRHAAAGRALDADSLQDSPRHAPYPLPLSDGSMGLYRILQGRALSQVHKVVYFATLFVFVTCIMKLYAMFGVYGVLTKDTVAEKWPWFVFNSCARFSELGAVSLVSWVTFTLARKRWRTRRKRKLRTNEMTRC